jgi:hypothetical protein
MPVEQVRTLLVQYILRRLHGVTFQRPNCIPWEPYSFSKTYTMLADPNRWSASINKFPLPVFKIVHTACVYFHIYYHHEFVYPWGWYDVTSKHVGSFIKFVTVWHYIVYELVVITYPLQLVCIISPVKRVSTSETSVLMYPTIRPESNLH